MQGVLTTISICCCEKCIGDIESVMSELRDTLGIFKKCCFGKLYKLPKISIKKNQVIYYVLSHEVSRMGPGDRIEVWFYVNNTFVRLSKFELLWLRG